MNKIINLDKFKNLSANQWDERIFHRAVNIKFPNQLQELVNNMYPNKINKLNNRLQKYKETDLNKIIPVVDLLGINLLKELEEKGTSVKDFIDEESQFLTEKINRLTDKFATCQKMLDLRLKKSVPITKEWEMHGTIYYIDFVNGNDANDGLAASNDHAWQTIAKYTTTTVRTAGDIAKIRANMTTTIGATIQFDEDGTVLQNIVLSGCSIADDPWGDASDVRPIIDFNNGNYYAYNNSDDFWKHYRLDYYHSGSSNYALHSYSGCPVVVENCRFYNNNSGGLKLDGLFARIIDCEFWNNTTNSLNLTAGWDGGYIIDGCIFNGGANGTHDGLYNQDGVGETYIKDSSFGQSTAHAWNDIEIGASTQNTLFIMNTKYTTYSRSTSNNYTYKTERRYEDDSQQVYGANKTFCYFGNIVKDTGVVRAGGATSSAKMTVTNTGVNTFNMFRLSGFRYDTPYYLAPFKIWLSASVEKTINIYLRGLGWAAFPTNSELWVEAWYYNDVGSCVRTQIKSDEVIADNATWVAFQVTLTPARDGFVYLDVCLGKYAANCGVYVDIKPVIS